MKTTETNQQLLERFDKRIKQLSEEQGKLDQKAMKGGWN